MSLSFLEAAPTILNYPIYVGPGSVICLQGEGFGAAPTAWLATNGVPALPLPTLNSGDNTLTTQLPATDIQLYYLVVSNNTGVSTPVCLNAARGIHFDIPDVIVGSVFRVIGRNLSLGPAWTPHVDLVNTATSNSYTATVGADASYYVLSVTTPGTMPAGNYQVWVSNGAGDWDTMKSLVPQLLAVRAPATDYWGLGVGWAADLTFYTNVYNLQTDSRLTQHAVGDGVANDLPAINAAITKATSAGGGIVYLPTGIYKITNANNANMITLAYRTVLQGDGPDSTIIRYGYGPPPTSSYHSALAFGSGTSQMGACNLQLTNVNESGKWTNSIYTSSGSPSSRMFLSNIRHEKGSEYGACSLIGDRFLIQGCVERGLRTGFNVGPSNYVVRGNNIIYSWSVPLNFNNTGWGLVESNTIILDASVTTNLITRHFVTANFTHDFLFANNTLILTNGPGAENNDTEAFLSEGGGSNRPAETNGTVVSASGSTVVLDTSAAFTPGSILCLVNGKGRGQWQNMTSRNGTTVTVAGPWAVTPDSTTRYSTFGWSAQNMTVFRNTFLNTRRGLLLYGASSTDVAIACNAFTNSVGMYLRPDQRLDRGTFAVLYNLQIVGNTLINNNGNYPAYIAIEPTQVNPGSTWGTGALNLEFRNNSIQGSGRTSFPLAASPFYKEGFICDLLNQSSPYVDQAIPMTLGTVFQWNVVTNCAVDDFFLSTGDYHTILANNPLTTSSRISDSTINGATHGSTSTYLRPVPTVNVRAVTGPAREFGLVPGSFTFTRTGTTDADMAVQYSMSGTASNGLNYVTMSGTAVIPAGSDSTTATITPLDDNLATGDLTAILNLSPDAVGNYSVGSPAAGTLVIADSPMDVWRVAQFGTNANNSAVGGLLGDPDGDGIPNLMEYALGGNPNVPDAAAILPQGAFVSGQFQYSFWCDAANVDITYTVQASDDLATWTDIAGSTGGAATAPLNGSGVTITDSGVGRRNVLVSIPLVSASQMFLRLQITYLSKYPGE